MVVRWNEVVENDQGLLSMIPGSKITTESQTESVPPVFVVHHISNKISWFPSNNVPTSAVTYIVKNENSTLPYIDDIPFIDEENLEISKEEKESNMRVNW